MEQQLIEKFEWPITEWKTVDVGKNTIRIKGVALKGDVVSKNNRQYVASELRKATNTWIGKPVNVNHNDNLKVGTIKYMDYDEAADLLTYEAEINRQPYVDMIRNRSTEIRGMSIQAGYLYNKCVKCGRKLYSEEEFRTHMDAQHFIKISPKSEPHGIMGDAISLVLSPEIPGFDGTTVELAETARRVTLQLLETVIKEEKEKEEYHLKETDKIKAPVALTARPEIAVGAVAEIKQPEPMTSEAAKTPAPPKAKEQDETPPEPQPEPEACPAGQHRDPDTGECVPDEEPTPEPAATEKLNVKLDFSTSPPKTVLVKETTGISKLAETAKPKLSLGEPFAGYSDFAACVAANQDKDNPEAYCGQIKHQTEGEMYVQRQVSEVWSKINEVVDEVNKPISVQADNLDWQLHNRQVQEALQKVTEHVNALPKDDLGWKKIKPYNDAPLKEVIANIKPYDDAALKEELQGLKTQNIKLQETVAAQEQKITEYKQEITQFHEDVNKVAGERNKTLEQLAKENAELKEHKEKELKEIKETLQHTNTTLENLQDKVESPSYKSPGKKLAETSSEPVTKDPLKEAEKKR